MLTPCSPTAAPATPDKLTLIDGHLREDLAPGIWPVLVLDVTDTEADYLLATHDPLTMMATANADALSRLLPTIETGSPAVQALLVALAEATGLLETPPQLRPPPKSDPGPRSTKPQKLQAEWQTALGQIWILGGSPAGVGDSTERTIVARLLGATRADCMWTDPPYGVSYVGKTADALTIHNDGAKDLAGLLRQAFAQADAVLKGGAPIYIAHPAGELALQFGLAFVAVGWHLHQTLVWVKDSMVLGHSDYHYQHEPLLLRLAGADRRGRADGPDFPPLARRNQLRLEGQESPLVRRPRPGLGVRDRPPQAQHPAPDHEAARTRSKRQLQNSTAAGDIVYDPFGGSGTTLIACERTKPRAAGRSNWIPSLAP